MTTPIHHESSDHGPGWDGKPSFAASSDRCPKCKGEGIIVDRAAHHYFECEWCGGSGWIETRHGQAIPGEASHD
jgi:DnaJ-class molecular chaperone